MSILTETDSEFLSERKFALTIYSNEKVTRPYKAGAVTLEKLFGVMSLRDTRPGKNGWAFSLHRLHEGGTRKNSDVSWLSGFVGDFDSGTTLDDLRPKLAGRTWAAYSSHSHDPENGQFKFRLILPFTRNVPASEWPEVWSGANVKFGSVADVQCSDPSRIYYMPSCPAETAHHAFFETGEGEYLDPDKLIEIARQAKLQQKPSLNAALSGGLDQNLLQPPPETPENVARVRSMLASIPADCSRGLWRDVVWAVMSTGWADAVNIAREWSMGRIGA